MHGFVLSWEELQGSLAQSQGYILARRSAGTKSQCLKNTYYPQQNELCDLDVRHDHFAGATSGRRLAMRRRETAQKLSRGTLLRVPNLRFSTFTNLKSMHNPSVAD